MQVSNYLKREMVSARTDRTSCRKIPKSAKQKHFQSVCQGSEKKKSLFLGIPRRKRAKASGSPLLLSWKAESYSQLRGKVQESAQKLPQTSRVLSTVWKTVFCLLLELLDLVHGCQWQNLIRTPYWKEDSGKCSPRSVPKMLNRIDEGEVQRFDSTQAGTLCLPEDQFHPLLIQSWCVFFFEHITL